jgi:hypothetical protein
MGRESTQECFDANQLMFIEDIKNGMPKDDNHPERAMLFGDGVDISYVMKLPDNIVGDMVLLQFIYWTANTCNYEGYKEYFTNNETPPSNKGNWSPSLIDCPKILPTLRGVEALTPEIFVNCAEITIQGAPTVPSPTPAPAPTPTPINQDPVEIPVTTGKLPPVDPNIVGTCGQGLIGNGICPAQTLCCSKFGYCGTVATRYVCDGRLLILLHLILLLYVFVCYVCHAFSVSHLNSLSLSLSLRAILLKDIVIQIHVSLMVKKKKKKKNHYRHVSIQKMLSLRIRRVRKRNVTGLEKEVIEKSRRNVIRNGKEKN